jgi:hypothetical protein
MIERRKTITGEFMSKNPLVIAVSISMDGSSVASDF